MQKRRLGRTNLHVSEISLGTVEIGMKYGIAAPGSSTQPDELVAQTLLNRALDLGINFIDVAPVYGESEEFIGKSLKNRRKEFFLVSKVYIPHSEAMSPAEIRSEVISSVTGSMKRLATTYIDILMVHSASAEIIARGAIAEALHELKKKGFIGFIGVSLYTEESALLAIRSGQYDCIQIPYSALDRRPEAKILPEARAHDVGIITRSVLLQGALTHRYEYLSEKLAPLKQAVRQLAAAGNLTVAGLPELSYRYVLSHSSVHSALVGTASLEELLSAVNFAGAGPLPKGLIESIHGVTISSPELLNPANWGHS